MSMTWCHCERSSPLALIPLGQWTTSGLRAAAVAAGDLLGPGERRVASHSPAGGVVRDTSSRVRQLVVVLENVGDSLRHAVEVGAIR